STICAASFIRSMVAWSIIEPLQPPRRGGFQSLIIINPFLFHILLKNAADTTIRACLYLSGG
ncbi:MAG TPA: hypothetical protein PK664_00410, partial [Paludibacteraceae bacterium]|nr:hypothetical protein [Paludibacteraceae bacterium]